MWLERWGGMSTFAVASAKGRIDNMVGHQMAAAMTNADQTQKS